MSKTILLNQNWIFSKEGHDEPVTLPHTWNAVDGMDGNGSYLRTRLDGRWKLNFTASSGDTANRIGTVSEPEVNGYTLSSVIAAPGETRVTVQLSADTPEGATLQLFSADGQKLQCASSRPSADSSAVSYDFDAAPADAAGLTVKLVDKNTDPLVELAQWDVILPTE